MKRKVNLRDHGTVKNHLQKQKVVKTYIKSSMKKVLKNHRRDLCELYHLDHVRDGNFLESINFIYKKNGKRPKELLHLFHKYQIQNQKYVYTSTVQPYPFPTPLVFYRNTPGALQKSSPFTIHPINQTPAPSPAPAPTTVLSASVSAIEQILQVPVVLNKVERHKIIIKTDKGIDKAGPSKSPKKFSEKMKAEAAVVQRVAELQKEGMWYDKRLPKCHEHARMKSHWDYLLEEMHWLATDFAYERKWKRIAARKCAKMVEKYHADKKIGEEKAKKDEKIRLQKVAAFMAKEIRNFWSNAQKLVEYKEQSKIEELRKKTMDQHLSFIVDQTEKISSMLAESFAIEVKPHRLALEQEIAPESVSDLKIFDDSLANSLSDDEFLPTQESEDDEETIALAETEAKDVRGELDLLKKESEMSIDDVLDDLPPEYLQVLLSDKEAMEIKPEQKIPEPSPAAYSDNKGEGETDYEPSGSESDVEDTILEEEKLAGSESDNNSAAELRELEEDNGLSLEQLRAKYNRPIDISDNDSTDVEQNIDSDMDSDSNENDDEVEVEDGKDDEDQDEEQQSSLATLLQTFAPERAGEDHKDDELNSVAAMAESFQPKGYTLSSTTVATKVPILLKHTLREYQHIGLDWLVTMYDKKLNGILADEMGLGKTIQTIALLAHLACEKENWGPHLIIVPTSVMLNWEMEFMKWMPGFKILTYYGSIKERKIKRIGWTKPNTFHVCITSYKILIQDHQTFRRKRWKYLILDEAQNIKNFKSQRWQLLLNFSTQRRLLLTGTPLQNNLMELWSLMHFLMPNVFQSHREFREWFSNPMTGMIEGNSEYNENIIRRLHKVLRPFILRRLKCEVEKQLPKKYEHVVMCRLSKRQRYLYEDFMSRAKTKETLQAGNLLSVINVLMQLRKVCNHPNLFEPRPIISPLQTRGLTCQVPSLVWNMMDDVDSKTVTYNIWSITQQELSMDKQTALKLETRVSKNYFLTVRQRPGTTIMESISFTSGVPKAEYARRLKELDSPATDEPVVDPVGDDDCAIVFERKHDPTAMRRVVYAYNKYKVPNPPRLRTPLTLFTMPDKPRRSLLQNPEFIEGISADAPPPQKLSRKQVVLNNCKSQVSESYQICEAHTTNGVGSQDAIVGGQKLVLKVTKLSNYNYPTRLATFPNGSEYMITPNGVCVQEPEKPKVTKVTNLPYVSRGLKRKRVYEYENKSLLDTIKVDFEAPPESQTLPEVEAETESELNGMEDEGSDEYEDSEEEESKEPLRKLSRIEKPVRRRSRLNSEPSKRISKYTEVGDEEEDDDETSVAIRKRKRSTATKSSKPKRLDLNLIEFEDVVYRKILDRKAVICNMRAINNKRLFIHTVYGSDLISQVDCLGVVRQPRYHVRQNRWNLLASQLDGKNHSRCGYFNLGYQEILMIQKIKATTYAFDENCNYQLQCHTKGLLNLVWTLGEILTMFEAILKRFMIYTPAVGAPLPQVRVFHPSVSRYTALNTTEQQISIKMKSTLEPLRPIFASMATQFPDPRLIQYDCGKLQVLDGLLRRLKSESHRALIFTQMSKMLDVLEAFLNYHGYIYLRLDGATKIEQRQLLMERFNTDPKIFCFILSTRSGGIGVNLTGADTVIFYDSDWNPTMDAQAQDRCHRIGQTRDVHIYRLVSEKTIEENILKKSNQKRLLGEIAIEGGNFTTAHFQKNSIHELFDVDEGEGDAVKRMAAILQTPAPSPPRAPQKNEGVTDAVKDDASKKSTTQIFETALAAAEDESDVQAARTVRAETAAELAEFDEEIPLEDNGREIEEPSKIEKEMDFIMSELSTVELYALRFMERTIEDWSKETYANAQKEIELQKMEWDLDHQNKAGLVTENQLIAETTVEDQLENMLTYPMLPQDFWYDDMLGFDGAPVFAPPFPPKDDEYYMDRASHILYDITNTIPDHFLPRVWSGPKKSKSIIDVPIPKPAVEDVAQENTIKKVGTAKVNRRDDPIFAPRSLFDRPSAALAKLRRDYKIQKLSKMASRFPGALSIVTSPTPSKGLGPGSITFPITLSKSQILLPMPPELFEWTIPEDNYLLQSMTQFLELPVNLLIVNPAQTPNWDFATTMVNFVSRTHRTLKQVRMRYEQVILPREEGRYFEPVPTIQPQKKKKINTKAFVKVSPPPGASKGRRLKTSEIVANDNNKQYREIYMKNFEAMKKFSKERPTSLNPMNFNANMRLPKQVAVFAEHNINFDTPVSAVSIAGRFQERLLAERAKLIAAQRAHQAELAAAQAARGARQPSGQIQVVRNVPTTPPEQTTHSQGIIPIVNTGVVTTSNQQSPAANTILQTSAIIGSLTSGSAQTPSPQKIPVPGSTTPVQAQLIPQQTQSQIQLQQGVGPTMIITQPSAQASSVVSSPSTSNNNRFPIVIPVSCTGIVRANTLLQQQQRQQTIQIQTPGNSLNAMQGTQRFIITQRDVQQAQHVQIQPPTSVASQQQILPNEQTTQPSPQGVVLSTIPSSIQQTSAASPTLQPSAIIGATAPALSVQTTSPQKIPAQNTATTIQIQQTPQVKTPIQVQQRAGQAMILTQSSGQTTSVTSSPTSMNSRFPIVIPVSCTGIVRANNLLQQQQRQQTIQIQAPGSSLNAMQGTQKFIITQRDMQQPQHVQLQPSTSVKNQQPILIAIPVSSVQGSHGAQSQAHQILFPSKGTTVTTATTATGHQIIVPVSQAPGVKNPGARPILATVCVQKGAVPNSQVSLVRGTVPPGSAPVTPLTYSTTIRQDPRNPGLVDYQKTQTLVSALSLARNVPQGARRYQSPNVTMPVSALADRRQHLVFSKDLIPVNQRLPMNPNTTIRPSYYTPVSQVSLVRGPISISSAATPMATLPLTYSTYKSSILRTPTNTTEGALMKPQYLQQQILAHSTPQGQQQIIMGSTQPPQGTVVSSLDIEADATPPQLISSPSSASNVITIYTTTRSTQPTDTIPPSTDPSI